MNDSLNKYVETPDISTALESCSFEWEIPVEELDFKIEREDISEDSAGNLQANYLVSIFPKDIELENSLKVFNFEIQFEENSATLSISKINEKNNDEFTEEQINYSATEILKLLFLNGIKYGYLVEGTIRKNIREKLKSNKENFTMEVAKGLDPQHGKDSHLEFHVPIEKIAGKVSENGTIDYKNIGTSERIISKGTEIATLSHATEGFNGIDIFGQIIKANNGVERHKIKIATEDTISVEEIPETNSTSFIALSKGLVIYNQLSGKLELKSEIETKEISFKNIGNIKNNTERLNMNIKGQKGSIDDAIKDGFELFAGNINVIGNIGNNVSIDCLSLKVEGKINSGSSILSENFIKTKNIYGSTLISKFIEIGTCMDSEIKADFVLINKAATTSIEAKVIVITESVKNCTFTASEIIIVGETSPMDNNLFNIKPLELAEYKEKLEIITNKLNNFKKQVKEIEVEKDKAEHKCKVLLKNITREIIRINELGYTVEKEKKLSQLVENKQFKALRNSLKLNPSIEKNIDEYTKLQTAVKRCNSNLNIKSKALEKMENEQKSITNLFTEGDVLFVNAAGQGTKVNFQSYEKIVPHNIKKSAYFYFDKTKEETTYKSGDYSSFSKIWNKLPDAISEQIKENFKELKNWHEPFEGIIQ